jgi:hypothetical protein
VTIGISYSYHWTANLKRRKLLLICSKEKYKKNKQIKYENVARLRTQAIYADILHNNITFVDATRVSVADKIVVA